MANKNNLSITEYDGIFDGVDVGYTKMDQTEAVLGFTYVRIESTAQFVGLVSMSKTGIAPTVKMTMLETQFDFILGTIASEQVYPLIDGTKKGYGLGSRKVNIETNAKTLRLKPVGVDVDDYTNDMYFWLSAPNLESVSYSGKRDAEQEVTVEFVIFPDDTKSLDFNYGIMGDWTATTGVDPFTIFLSTEARPTAPYNADTAISMLSGATKKVYAHGLYKTDTSITSLTNEVGTVLATDLTFDFDTLSTASNFAVGDFVLMGTEIVRITSVTYATTTSGTLIVDRHIGGTTAAIHADNATMTKLSDVYVIPVTNRSTWASSVVADVTVGDSNSSSNKGLLTWITDGSSDITAVVGSTTSATLTITAVA